VAHFVHFSSVLYRAELSEGDRGAISGGHMYISGAHNHFSGENEALSGGNSTFSGERVTNIKTRTVKSPSIVRTAFPGTSHLVQQKPTNHNGSGLSKHPYLR